MGSAPPPKDGEVTLSSTELRRWLKQLQSVTGEIYEKLEDAGYGDGKSSE